MSRRSASDQWGMSDEVEGLADWMLVFEDHTVPVSAPMPDDEIDDVGDHRRWSLGVSNLDSDHLQSLVGRHGVLFGPGNERVAVIRIDKVSTALDLLVATQMGPVLDEAETASLPVSS